MYLKQSDVLLHTPWKTNMSPKKRTISIGNTSTPTINFQGKFVSFGEEIHLDIFLFKTLLPFRLRRDGKNKERQDLHSHRSRPGAIQISKVSSTNEAQDTWGFRWLGFQPSFLVAEMRGGVQTNKKGLRIQKGALFDVYNIYIYIYIYIIYLYVQFPGN